MTDLHCCRCRLRVRLYRHSRGAPCPACGGLMRLGAGRRTRPDPRLSGELDQPGGAELMRRALDTRRADP